MKNIQDCGSCSAKFWVLIRPCNANVQAVAASDWPLENGKTATRLEHFVHWESLMAGKVIQANVTEFGHWLSQDTLAYEVRMTSKKPEEKWRKNHVIMAVAKSVEEAIAMCKDQYPDDPIIDQVVLRNRGMDLILAGSIVSQQTIV